MTQPGPAAKAPTTKYTLLLDPATRAYQRHLRRTTDINFSDFIRALIARVAQDKQLEADIFAACGGGYEEDPLPATPAPSDGVPAVSLTLPDDQDELVAPERDLGEDLAALLPDVTPEPAVEAVPAAEPTPSRVDEEFDVTAPEEPGGFWGVDEFAAA